MAYSQQQGLQNESANQVLAGPTSGGAAKPSFRALVAADIPFGPAGGVNAQTISYTAVSGDSGKLISMNGSSLTLTLPASPPSSTWFIAVENVSSTSLTISRNGLTIDGAASNLPLTQNQGVFVYTDGSNYFTSRGIGGSGGSGSAGGVNAQTVSYTAVSGDNGKLISMNGSSLTLTLPASPPSATWWIAIENTNASNLIVSRNGLNIDGSASNLTVTQNQGLLIFTDGSNYFTSRGVASGSGVTLETNGTLNGSQTLLNLAQGTNVTISDNGTGTVTISSSAGGSTDSVDVNSTDVADASITALVNGTGPVGEVEVNGFLAQNNTPCLLENTNINLASALRVLGTVYQNPYNVPILVEATFLTSTATTSTFTGFSDSSSSPSTVVFKDNSPNVSGSFMTVTMFVLPNQFYKITSSIGTPTVSVWREFRLMTGTFADSGEIHTSRSLATVFQNTTGKLMFVVAQIGSVTSASSVQGISDTQPSPHDVIDDATHTAGASATVTIFMPVPPGHFYKVTAASGSLSLWHEYTWTVPVTKSNNLFLSTGFGQTRSIYGVSQAASVANTVATTLQLQNWQNDTFRVRWAQVIYSTTSTLGSCLYKAGDGIPPFLAIGICSQNAAVNRAVHGPVLPWKFYSLFDNSTGTITPVSWFEYQLG